MSARDDYPTKPEPGGFHFAVDMHGAMCDEIDRLRAERDALLARRDEVMRASGDAVKLLKEAHESKSTSAFIVAATEAAGPSEEPALRIALEESP